MLTVSAVAARTGLSARTLRYYDRIGLLSPDAVTEAGYRLYGERALERLRQILLFRELEFPLEAIRRILDAPDFDRERALRRQIELLTLKKERLEAILRLAVGIETWGVNTMDFSAFDRRKIDEYAARARAEWGETAAYQDYARRAKGRSATERDAATARLMAVFAEFAALRGEAPDGEAAQKLAAKLRARINEDFYACTPEIFRSLGQMYAANPEFAANIDAAGGPGTAAFAAKAIGHYCERLG